MKIWVHYISLFDSLIVGRYKRWTDKKLNYSTHLRLGGEFRIQKSKKQKKLSQPSPKSYPNSNLGLAGQHNWS